jgi:predicted aldo/keto reductase-like oxidoreductase
MKYRKFGKLDVQVSALGFGCMRLPILGGNAAAIDEPEATRMLRYAIDHGVNYVDTAYAYHDGNSELVVGRALKDGYRQKVYLATKLPTWLVKTADDFDRLLNEQLQKLQTDHIDFYLLHSLNANIWPTVRDLGVTAWAERAIAQGRIGHLGFSFHDTFKAFKGIVDDYDRWEFCQIQYNYVDEKVQAGRRGLHYAAARGMGVVVMEPIRGGRLAAMPQPIAEILQRAKTQRTPADWALQWVWNQPEVSLALSGMSAMQHVVENLASADASGPGTLSAQDLALIAEARKRYRSLFPIPCTDCRYCMPCPNNVWIPHMFELYNRAIVHDALEEVRRSYNEPRRPGEDNRAAACIACRECEKLCPQKIPIADWMEEVHAVLGEGREPKAKPQVTEAEC